MKQKFASILIAITILFILNLSFIFAQEKSVGTYIGEDTGIKQITSLTIASDGREGVCLYAEGESVDTDTQIYMVLQGPRGEETTCERQSQGRKISDLYCFPGVGFDFPDGQYLAAFLDPFYSVKMNEALEKGYRIYFEIKNNVVQPGWEVKAESAANPPLSSKSLQDNASTPSAISISDIKDHWAEGSIKKLVESGILKGYPDGSFRPDAEISRAEFSQVVKNAFHIQRGITTAGFDDVRRQDWHFDAISTLHERGIVSGTGEKTFSPDQNITREQMAVILYKTSNYLNMDLAVKREHIPFADNNEISGYAKEAVKTLYQAEILNGAKGTMADAYYFYPLAGATRAEVTAIVDKLLNHLDE